MPGAMCFVTAAHKSLFEARAPFLLHSTPASQRLLAHLKMGVSASQGNIHCEKMRRVLFLRDCGDRAFISSVAAGGRGQGGHMPPGAGRGGRRQGVGEFFFEKTSAA